LFTIFILPLPAKVIAPGEEDNLNLNLRGELETIDCLDWKGYIKTLDLARLVFDK